MGNIAPAVWTILQLDRRQNMPGQRQRKLSTAAKNGRKGSMQRQENASGRKKSQQAVQLLKQVGREDSRSLIAMNEMPESRKQSISLVRKQSVQNLKTHPRLANLLGKDSDK